MLLKSNLHLHEVLVHWLDGRNSQQWHLSYVQNNYPKHQETPHHSVKYILVRKILINCKLGKPFLTLGIK